MPSSITSSRLQRRRRFFRRLRLYAYGGGIFLLLIGALHLFIGSGIFKIATITISSVEPIDNDALLATLRTQVAARPVAAWFGTDSYFAWPLDLHYTAPTVSAIKIEKSFWDKKISVIVVPRSRYAVWCATETSCGWVDETGVLFQSAPIAEGQLVQTIFDSDLNSLSPVGEPVLASSSFAVIREAIDGIKKINLGVTRIVVDRGLQELHLTTNSGARIFLSLRFDPNPAAIPAIRRFAEKPGFEKIDYLNLAVENRAYVKYR